MKKLLPLLMSAAILFSTMPSAVRAGDCYTDPVYHVTGSGTIKSAVFLRDKACIDGSAVLQTLTSGASVNVVAYTDGWYSIEYGGARGWIGEQFLINEAVQSDGSMSYQDYTAENPSRGSSNQAAPSGSVSSSETVYTGEIGIRSLIKLACPTKAASDDPCKAVYYIGADGKRHAFPNSKVFFTWYENFDSVRSVTAERLGQFVLGANITYRPGLRMVKFTTDPKVYVVSRGGILRWLTSEALARNYYGYDWNKRIDDIPDTFYTNYAFGDDIIQESDFNPSQETAYAPSFD